MRQGVGRAWGLLGSHFRQGAALPRLALSGLGALVRQKVARRRALIVVAAIFVCIYAAGVLGYVMLTPEIGVQSAFVPVVNHFDQAFLYPTPDNPPLKANDTIIQLGNQSVSSWTHILHKLAHLRLQPAEPGDVTMLRAESGPTHLVIDGEEVIKVRYRRGDDPTPRTAWCRVGRPPLEALVPSVLWFLLKIGLFVVGALVFWKRPEELPAAVFFLFCLASFGAYMGGYHWARIATQPALLVVFIVCSVLLPAVSLHFYLLFPRPKRLLARHPWWMLLAIYGPPVLFLLLFVSGYFRVRWLYQSDSIHGVELLLRELLAEILCYFGVAVAWYLASIVCLVHSYRSAVHALERNQVKWILFGSLASLAPIGYSLYLAWAEQQRFGGGAATWPMFFASLCVTVAFTVSITRYRLMQLDQVISSGVIYFLISSLAGLLYYGLVFTGMVVLGSHVIDKPSLGQVLSVGGLVLVLLLARDLVRDRFQSALARHFRRDKHQLDHTLQRMSQAIEELVDPPTLGKRLLHTAAELLGAGRGAVYLREGEPPLYHLADAIGPAPELSELSSGCPLVEALLSSAGQLLLPPRPDLPPGRSREGRAQSAGFTPAQRQLHLLGGVVAQALLHEGQLVGLLFLGPPGGPRGLAPDVAGGYSAEDLNLLAAFAQMTALALVSAEGHRKIEGLNRELQAKVEKIAEQQRRILALQHQLSAIGHRLSAAEGGPSPDAPAPLPDGGVIGSSPQVQQLMHRVRKVAASDSVVLLRGESGTGKEVLAHAIHDNSPRAARPFVAVHCAALSPGVLESELFGHVKGAFTSAHRERVGRFEAADGGTLFLDEIGDLSPEVQVKLLRVLQEKTFERVGSSEPVKVDVRIITATHQDLEAQIRQGRFREDLYFRINTFEVRLPPLRERVEDVPELAQYFLRRGGQRLNKPVASIDDDAMARLKAYAWPGNVRELENVIEHALVVAERPVVTVEELPAALQADPAALPRLAAYRLPDDALAEGSSLLRASEHWPAEKPTGIVATPPGLAAAIEAEIAERERHEREQLVRALAQAGGNKAEAARALGMARSTLVSRLKKLGLT